MFTGIIEEVGQVAGLVRRGQGMEVTIACKKVLQDVHIGDSISTNGVCLTVTGFTDSTFTADVMPETFNLANYKHIKLKQGVNLERAMKADGRFGGHMVAGHIDGTGRILSMTRDHQAVRIFLTTDPATLRYVIYKGSVALDGISLTVSRVSDQGFEVSVIPQTLEETHLSQVGPGYEINIETDIVGRYIERFMTQPKGITESFLKENGFI